MIIHVHTTLLPSITATAAAASSFSFNDPFILDEPNVRIKPGLPEANLWGLPEQDLFTAGCSSYNNVATLSSRTV